jgi:hypothetical protein
MFGALLAHPQEVLHKRYVLYCVVLCHLAAPILVQSADNTHAIYQVPHVQDLLRMNK